MNFKFDYFKILVNVYYFDNLLIKHYVRPTLQNTNTAIIYLII